MVNKIDLTFFVYPQHLADRGTSMAYRIMVTESQETRNRNKKTYDLSVAKILGEEMYEKA